MTEAKRYAHQRLQERTDDLAGEQYALGLDRMGFSKSEHDGHSADLSKQG